MKLTLVAQTAADRPPAPSEDIAQLRAILGMVDEIAGTATTTELNADLAALDERYAAAPGLIRARYARMAARTSSFSAAGVAALIDAPASARRSAAEYLAGEMRHAIGAMAGALR